MLLRQTLLYLPAQLIGPLALFVAGVVWTHLMPPGPYGTLMLIMAVQEFVFGVALGWLSLTILRYRDSLERAESAQRFRGSEAALIYGSIVAQAVAVLCVMPLFGRTTPELVAAAGLFIVTRSLLAHFAERMRAGGDVLGYTIAQSAGPTLGFALALVLTQSSGATPVVALLGYGIAQFATLPYVWVRSGAGFAPQRPTEALLTPLFRYGLPLLLTSAATWACINGVRLVVDALEGAVALGLISVGWGLGQRLASMVAMLVTAAAFPLAVKAFNAGDRPGALDQLARNGSLLVALLAPTVVGLVLVNETLVRLIIADAYWATTIAILPLAALSGALRSLRMHYADQAFLLHERTGFLFAATVAEAILTLALGAIGATMAGAVGAVGGVAIAHGTMMVVMFAQGARRFGLVLRWGDLARIAAATAIMAIVVRVMPMDASAQHLAAAVVVGAAAYGVALAALFPEMLGKLRAAAGV